MITVEVPLGERSYSIHIGQRLLPSMSEWIPQAIGRCQHAIIITDARLRESMAASLCTSLEVAGYRWSLIEVPSGESSKSADQAARLWQALLDEKTDRGSAVIALGGGVIGDLAGFVAATFARGLPLIQVPTTLLSQVDSSVGGKTGINLPQAKNMVGAFWQPSLVIIDTQTLTTLPDRELIAGMAEVVKYGVILKPDLFAFIEEHAEAILARDATAITHIIAESCRAKAEVVSQDERETTGLRAILNYGHTFGHALESDGGYGKYLHGEAVAIGMHLAAMTACALGRIDQSLVDRQHKLIQRLGLPTTFSGHDPEQLWKLMQHDKKVQHGSLRFVLPDRLGHVELVPGVEKPVVMDVLNRVSSQSNA